MLICKKCGSDNLIKKGFKGDKQTYKCKYCGSRAYPIDTEKEVDNEILKEN